MQIDVQKIIDRLAAKIGKLEAENAVLQAQLDVLVTAQPSADGRTAEAIEPENTDETKDE